ncbi:radical SAM domain-containing protein, partial [Thermoanaerobacter ethanolicus JW 200]
YEEWIIPKIVSNALELLDKEIPKLKDKIHFVYLSFMTDPFMIGYPEVVKLSLEIIKKLNKKWNKGDHID